MSDTPQPRARERRRHVVYLTWNTEYHCRDEECVGVRDRSSGRWQRAHPALRGQLLGGVARGIAGVLPLQAGLRLVFSAQQAVVTSPLVMEGRPDREAVFHYTSLCRSGEILAA
jgi:hypothetical protein